MKRSNRFHLFVDVNRRFLANGTIVAGHSDTSVSINVDPDPMARDAVATVLLLAAHSVIVDDAHRQCIHSILTELGMGKAGPVKNTEISAIEALAELEDETYLNPQTRLSQGNSLTSE